MDAIGWWTPWLRALALAAVTLVAACAPYTKALSTTEKPRPDRGYLYGRFHIDTERVALGMDGHQSMGFVMRCDDGNNYTIRFSGDNRVQIIAVRPARCWMVEVVFTDADGIVRDRKPQRGVPLHGFALAAGAAYYLGDYEAESTFLAYAVPGEYTAIAIERDRTWRLRLAKDNYDATTAEMKRTFANLVGLSTENRMLLPPRQPPGDARKREDDVRTPPADVVSPELGRNR